MTDREIRLEIAKAALIGGYIQNNLQEVYDWVMEEPEKEVVNKDVDDKSIGNIVDYIQKLGYRSGGYAVRLERIFRENGIKTIGDLLRMGKTDFLKIRDVGKGSTTRIDDALEELYGITGWYKT